MKKLVIVLFLVLVMGISVFAVTIPVKDVKETSTDNVDIIAPSKLKSKVTRHVYGLGHVADVTNGRITYYHQDRLGSTRLVTDSEGEVVVGVETKDFGGASWGLNKVRCCTLTIS